jgi:hypothetical protein
MVQNKAGVTYEEFDAYYEGVSTGIGIFFSELWRFPEPIQLEDLQEQMLGFHPPQGFRYATASELASLKLVELLEDTEVAMQCSFLDKIENRKPKDTAHQPSTPYLFSNHPLTP